MAARSRKVKHDATTREKIRTSQLLNRLHYYALGELDPATNAPVELDSGQVKAIEILLRKSMPDLSSVEGNMNVAISHEEVLGQLEHDAGIASVTEIHDAAYH